MLHVGAKIVMFLIAAFSGIQFYRMDKATNNHVVFM